MSFIKEKILMGTHSSMGARERVMGFFFFFFSLLSSQTSLSSCTSTTVVSFSFLAFLYFLVASSTAFTLQAFALPHGLIFNQARPELVFTNFTVVYI
jgi:hypothetical protein